MRLEFRERDSHIGFQNQSFQNLQELRFRK
nr:MAG TPA: hypothetical protein [Caudoviricetes sp.]